MKDMLTYKEFKEINPTKDHRDVEPGDIVYLSCGTHFKGEDNSYHRTVCDFRCGKDEFAGERHDGCRVGWCDMDWYKIVGSQITIS